MNKKLSTAIIIFLMLIIGGFTVLIFVFFDKDKADLTPMKISQEEMSSNKKEKIDTSTWKLYQNETFGYELRYPSDWVIGTTFGADPYTFSAPDFSPAKNYSDGLKTIPSFSINSIHKVPEGEKIEMNMPLGNRDGRIIEKKKIKLDGRDALFVEYLKTGYGEPNGKVGRVQQQIKVIDAGVAYHLEMQEHNQEEKLFESSDAWENKAIFQAILDSFHFFENNEVNIALSGGVDKKVSYINKDLGFFVILPADWEKYQVSIQQDKGNDKQTYVYFMMPTTDKAWLGVYDKKTDKNILGVADIFVITVTDLATWNKEVASKECLENPNPSCPDVSGVLAKNDKYVFSANYGNGFLPEDVQKFVEKGTATNFLKDKFNLL